jgi:hypothetical protein
MPYRLLGRDKHEEKSAPPQELPAGGVVAWEAERVVPRLPRVAGRFGAALSPLAELAYTGLVRL